MLRISKMELKYLISYSKVLRMLTCKDFGLDCNNPAAYCLCLCPYCGKNNKKCRCNQNFTSKPKPQLPKKISKHNSIIRVKDSLIENHIGIGWWRLEKWQIGKSKFS